MSIAITRSNILNCLIEIIICIQNILNIINIILTFINHFTTSYYKIQKEKSTFRRQIKHNDDIFVGIQTIAARGKLPPSQDWGLGQGQGQFQGWGSTKQFPPRKMTHLVRVRVWVGGGGNSPRGQLSQNQFCPLWSQTY